MRVREKRQTPEPNPPLPAGACFCRLAGPAVWCTPARQTRRATSASRVVRRYRAFDLRELFSTTLKPCEVGFHPLPAATHGGQQRASRTEQDRPRFASIINGVFGWEQFVLHALYLSRRALAG